MASPVPKVHNHLIENMEMDHFGITTDRLATIEVGLCICFAIILNDGQKVLLEHRGTGFLR